MDVLRGTVFLLSLTGYQVIVHKKWKILGWFVPLLTLCSISLFMYVGGLLGLLKETAGVVFIGGLLCFIYVGKEIWEKKLSFHVPTLSMVCVGAGSLFFLLLVRGQNVSHYDNFSHWALIVKFLLSANRYPAAADVLIPFKEYPPGTSVFLYYVCTFLGREEGVMLMGQTALILAGFSALFGIVRESRRFFLYSFLGMGCSMLSYLNLTIRINNLLVDFLLPVLTLASIVIAHRYCGSLRKQSLCVMVVLGFTAIVKDTGPVFAAIAFLYYSCTVLKKKDVPVVVRLMQCFGTGLGAGIPYLLWKYHCSRALEGLETKFSITAALTGYKTADIRLRHQIVRSFFETAADLSGRAAQVFLLCHVLVFAAVWYARVRLKKRWKLGKTLLLADAILALYYLGILGMYLYVMPEDEAVRLAGFERYACSIMVFFAGLLFLRATMDMEDSFAVPIDERGGYRAFSSPEAKRRYQYAVLISFIIGVNFLYSEGNGLSALQALYGESLPARVKKITGDRWYPDGKMDDKSYFVVASDRQSQVSDWSVWYVCRYFLFAANIVVTDRLDDKLAGEELWKYDYLVIVEEEAVLLTKDSPYYDSLRQPGMYNVELLLSEER